MSEYEYSVLSSENDIIEYEKGLYKAFHGKDPDGWIFNNYELIDNCRLRSKIISYKNQRLYALKSKNEIIAGGAISLDTKGKLQLEMMGFSFNKKAGENFCEALNFYILEDLKGEDFLKSIGDFFSFMIRDVIKKYNIYISYGTCSRKLKSFYTVIGWDVIDKIDLNGVKKLLIRYDAKKNEDSADNSEFL